jgi:hypothetical protein
MMLEGGGAGTQVVPVMATGQRGWGGGQEEGQKNLKGRGCACWWRENGNQAEEEGVKRFLLLGIGQSRCWG